MRIVILVGLALLLIAAGMGLRLLRLGAQEPGATWQSSEAAAVQLGVRDKYGSLGAYTADFVVIGPKGEKRHAYRKVKDDAFAFVYFPDDFQTWGAPGRYAWKCLVGTRAVVGGKFQVTASGVIIGR